MKTDALLSGLVVSKAAFGAEDAMQQVQQVQQAWVSLPVATRPAWSTYALAHGLAYNNGTWTPAGTGTGIYDAAKAVWAATPSPYQDAKAVANRAATDAEATAAAARDAAARVATDAEATAAAARDAAARGATDVEATAAAARDAAARRVEEGRHTQNLIVGVIGAGLVTVLGVAALYTLTGTSKEVAKATAQTARQVARQSSRAGIQSVRQVGRTTRAGVHELAPIARDLAPLALLA